MADHAGEPASLLGLTLAEVGDRQATGRSNDVPRASSRTIGEIVRANVFTRFNAILGTLLVVIIAVGEYRDALFGIVLVLNAATGIVQELKAKQTLDELAVVGAPKVSVRRDGELAEVQGAEIVEDDLIVLAPGDQLVVDGEVLDSAHLEIDESLLTGESDPVPKSRGDSVLSGSFVSVGSGLMKATAVGAEAYAYKLAAEAKEFSLVDSELKTAINQILRAIQWILIPTGVLLVLSQMNHSESTVEAVQGSVAGLGAMIPEGLVLLTSLAFAAGVIRLGNQRVLTQELAAIEGLARVDVICLDKTGTLTENDLEVDHVDSLIDGAFEALGALATSDPNPNGSLLAIARFTSPPANWTAVTTIPFSSARKWSAADFGTHGRWFLGAPDILSERVVDSDSVLDAVRRKAQEGSRVILLARSADDDTEGELADETLPNRLKPAALVVLAERLRPDAPETIAYFLSQNISVKVISGDHPETVGAVAARVGVPDADRPVDARTLPDDEDALADILDTHSVFGRVTPQQKRAMVHALQHRDHVVAMTGDGVNDTLALKDADIGVSMGSGSPAARAVARFVLLDNSFAVFPSVVAEGRRVIANVERVANLFLTKTVYATLLALAVGVAGLPFPFYPRHLTVVSSLTIGIPAFFLALAPNPRRYRPGFLNRVLRFAIPTGTVAAVATFAGYALASVELDLGLAESRTTATLVLFWVALWVLGILTRPFNLWRGAMIATMAGGFLVVLVIPSFRNYFEFAFPELTVTIAAAGIAAVACAVLEVAWRVAGWVEHHPGLPTYGVVPERIDVSDERFPLFEFIGEVDTNSIRERLRVGRHPFRSKPSGTDE